MGAAAAIFDLLPVGATVALGTTATRVSPAWPPLVGAGPLGRDARRRRGHARWLELAADADLLWLESPSNPLLAVADLPTICAASQGRTR